ncbi:hypothetical protein ACFFWC_28085 [Plantactinospora siamensis]|uniref:Uncharacterized protein n=1 Tax=Plantactinospora siamensis TaxID=555372 RepID=A0ABV6NQ62_9ACTN
MTGPSFPGSRMGLHLTDPGTLGGLDLLGGGSGLVLGRNRDELPVAVRLFRPEPTRMLLVGGVRCAQLLAFRTMALGARLFIQTAREQDWDAFLRRCAVGRDSAAFLPVGTQPPAPASSVDPQLVLVDIGPTAGPEPVEPAPWRATLVVRDDLANWDVDAIVRSDVVLLQRLTQPEAAIAASALGLTEAQGWLPRIHPEMAGVVSKGRLQWVMLGLTPTEQNLLGSAARSG